MRKSRNRPSPQFPLYVDDWLGSTKIALMSPAEEGAYHRLLCHMWNSPGCCLPNDDKQLAVLSRLGEKWYKGSGEKIKKCFIKKRGTFSGVNTSYKLTNKRLLVEWNKQHEYVRKCKEAGLKSAKVRREKHLRDEGRSNQVPSTGQGGSNQVPTTLPTTLQHSNSNSYKNKKERNKAKKEDVRVVDFKGTPIQETETSKIIIPTVGDAALSSRDFDRDILQLWRTYKDQRVCSLSDQKWETFYKIALACMENGYSVDYLEKKLVEHGNNGGSRSAYVKTIWKDEYEHVRDGYKRGAKHQLPYLTLTKIKLKTGSPTTVIKMLEKECEISREEAERHVIAAGVELEKVKE